MCEHMQGDVLKAVDPILHSKLAAEGVEGQLWGMYVDCPLAVVCVSDDAEKADLNALDPRSRYIRLLFTREMSFGSALRIWDGLFTVDSLDQMMMSMCIALLLRIRHLCEPHSAPVARDNRT